MPDLKRYRAKRDPERTPEPFGDDIDRRARPAGGTRAFVVQQHDARNMHWDLRLDIDDVLVSWAIPRGPSLDPGEKRLAVRTEDHPLEYAEFEGIIPSGNYGAGAMIVWDRGVYNTVGEATPGSGLESGKLDLLMRGHKLVGRFALVRTRGEDGKSWLLLRKGDPPDEQEELIEAQPASVLSGLTVHELRDGVTRDADVAARIESLDVPERAAPGADDPKSLRPMLAATADEPFSRDGWIFEMKYDGMRVLASRKADGEVRLWSRTGRDATATYPEIARALAHLPLREFVLDGEIVHLDERGQPSFERLQRRFGLGDPDEIARAEIDTPVVLYAFDLPFALGRDLRAAPLSARKLALAGFVPATGQVRFADHVEGDGLALFDAVKQHDMEGVLAKRADSRYEAGKRSDAWLKIKVPRSAPLVIVGWTPGKGARSALGSLVLGWYRGDDLHYAGNAGSGLDDQTIEALLPRLEASSVERAAFRGEPPARARFTRPELVCEARYTEVTSSGLLRHPVFAGLREDIAPAECRAPMARDAGAVATPTPRTADAELRLTRPEKIFWPVEGYTKGDLLAYYEAAWPWLAPYLRDRPLVLTRYPDGIEGKFFYQKNAPEFTPDWVEREQIEGTDFFICNELRELLYVINSGAIPLHVWHSRRGDLERPDWLILDLDPKEAPFAHVVGVARHIHALLDELGAAHFVKTSGQDGLHVVLPLGGQLDHDQSRQLAEVLARVVCADIPDIATIARPLAARADKVYVDFLQNGRGKLIASVFSVRPRAGAPVSMPLTWRQVTARLDPTRFTIKTALGRIEKGGDPFLGVLGEPVDVEALLGALMERLAAQS